MEGSSRVTTLQESMRIKWHCCDNFFTNHAGDKDYRNPQCFNCKLPLGKNAYGEIVCGFVILFGELPYQREWKGKLVPRDFQLPEGIE
jgi:hypothetical protein